MLGRAFATGILLLAFAGCGSGDDPSMTADEAPSTSGPAASGGGDEPADAGAIEVVASDFRFAPDVVEIAAGEEARLVLRNKDGASHTMTAEELSLDVAADPGESAEAAVTAPEPGTFEWVCRIHPSMKGTIEVT